MDIIVKGSPKIEIEFESKVTNVGGNFNPSGTYPDLVAGDLAGRGESVPAEFTFRASGGKSIKDGRAYIKAVKGNSVVWNNASAVVEGGNAALPQGARLIRGHKYLIIANRLDGYGMYVFTRKDSMNIEVSSALQKDNGIRFFTSEYDAMSTGVAGQENSLWWYVEGNYGQANLHDLTQMFGAGNEPSTIEEYEARKPIVEDENAYNEGEVIHMTAEGIKSIGDNAFDTSRDNFVFPTIDNPGDFSFMNESDVYVGVTDNGYGYKESIDKYSKIGNGYAVQNNNGGYGLGFMVKALPNQEYALKWNSDKGGVSIGYYDADKHVIDYNHFPNRFTTPSNCEYLLLVVLSLDDYIGQEVEVKDIMLTLVHSGWKVDTDAGYQPYWEDTLPLPIISNYFPDGMQSAGSAHDEIRYNKATQKWEAVQRIGSVRVADYVRRDAEGVFILSNLPKKPANNINGEYSTNVLMAGYTSDLGAYSYEVKSEARIVVVRDTIWLNAENLKQYASTQEYIDVIGDTKVFYELAEPIVTEITEDFRDYYKVADFGTEELLTSMPSAPFSADIIYQFNAVDMIREHELEITELQKVIATMQAQLASLTNN